LDLATTLKTTATAASPSCQTVYQASNNPRISAVLWKMRLPGHVKKRPQKRALLVFVGISER
jgi:hypothetical protein